MYNEELKKRYIKEKSEVVVLPSSYLSCQFNKIEKLETELNKDLAEFNTDEIMNYYKSLNISSLECLIVMNSHFSLYVQWCIQNGHAKNSQNYFLDMTMEQIKECLNKELLGKKIVTRKQVIEWCDSIPNPKDELVLLGLFEGIKGKDFSEFVNLRPEDINGNVVTLIGGRQIKISNKLLSYMEASMNENVYYSISGGQTKNMPLVDRGYVIKQYPNVQEGKSDFAKGRIIYNSITRSLNYVGAVDFVSANNIHESGKIHMIKERAKKLKMSPQEYVYSNRIREVEERFNCRIVRSTFWLKYEDYLK